MFDLFAKKKSVDEIIKDANLAPSWEWTPTQTRSMLQAQNELIEQFLKENHDLKVLLKSIEEDGTTEHNNAIKLRQEVASLKAFQEGLIHERDTARDLLTKLKKDLEDQKQLKDSLQRVNEKYIKKITEQEDKIVILKNAIERWHSRSKAWEKLDEELKSSVSELTKEVIGLRHLKKENVELIERLEKEGNSYGMTFNEAKTQIIQNDYKKCAEERDEYKHQLNAANKMIEVLKKERDILKRWKYEQLIVNKQWDKVDDYMRNHDDAPLGNFVANTCLDFLKERDELKTELEKLKKDETQKHPMYPLHWGGYDKNIIDFVKSEFSNEDPVEGKQVEFNSEELLKRATECAESLDSLPKSFPDEFQEEISWEQAASDLALKVAQLEEIIENQLKQIEEIKAFGNKLTKMTYQDSYYEYFMKHGKWPW